MLASTEQFLAYLNANKLKYDYTEPEDDDKKDVVVVRFTGHNLSTITVQFFFSTDGEDAAIRVLLPSGKTMSAISAGNCCSAAWSCATRPIRRLCRHCGRKANTEKIKNGMNPTGFMPFLRFG